MTPLTRIKDSRGTQFLMKGKRVSVLTFRWFWFLNNVERLWKKYTCFQHQWKDMDLMIADAMEFLHIRGLEDGKKTLVEASNPFLKGKRICKRCSHLEDKPSLPSPSNPPS